MSSTTARDLRRSRPVLAALLGIQAVFVALNVAWPGWRLINLDQEHNLPTWFQSGLLALAALLALDLARAEARMLGRAGRGRIWVAAWLGVAVGFAYLAADETLVIHEGLLTDWLRGRLAPASPLQLTLAWLLIFLPSIVLTVAFLLASLGARARLCPRLVAWGGAGLAFWIAALTLEGTAKSFFIPRNLYWLEVLLEETAEPLGTICFAWAFWRYRLELGTWTRDSVSPPAFVVPWRWVAAGTLALVIPVAVVGLSIAWNPYALHRYVGDDHLRAGRLEEAVRAYRTALAAAPGYGRAWYRLGVAELRRGDLAAAEEAFKTAARLEPRNAAVANDLGVVFSRRGRDAEAAASFARAIALNPDDIVAAQNWAVALRALGRDAEAAAVLARFRALQPLRLEVTELRVARSAQIQLAYLGDPRIAAALAESRAGRVETAVSAYRRVLAVTPDVAAAHLGLANELVRWRVTARLATSLTGARSGGIADAAAGRPVTLFEDWLRDAGGVWRAMETVVEAPAGAFTEAPTDPRTEIPAGVGDRALAQVARRHFQQALMLGAEAAAHVGLAALAQLEGDLAAAGRHLSAARAADPSVPVTPSASSRAAVPR
jgi:tetratricopeptide (TPR) repeat protein